MLLMNDLDAEQKRNLPLVPVSNRVEVAPSLLSLNIRRARRGIRVIPVYKSDHQCRLKLSRRSRKSAAFIEPILRPVGKYPVWSMVRVWMPPRIQEWTLQSRTLKELFGDTMMN
jgi:hypothetical protein